MLMNRLTSAPLYRLVFGILLTWFSLTSPAQAQDEAPPEVSQPELEQILAPIALYPDTILSHILVAATYPLEVVQAERWTTQNPSLQGQDAVEAVQEFDWDPSVQALVAFPQILKRMSEDLEWTKKLGDAFLFDEAQVLASVQDLRELAEDAGSLDKMDKVTVTRDREVIIIEPRRREVVYVPYYDTRVVYGAWRWPHYQPVFWDYPYAYSPYHGGYYAHHSHSSFFWGPSISLSFGFYSSAFHWHDRYLVRLSPHYYHPRRYYSHNDIIRHRNAQRWEHDARRRYSDRNRYATHRNYEGERIERAHREDVRVERRIEQPQFQQQQVRNRLAEQRALEQRNAQIDTNRARRIDMSQARTSTIENGSRSASRNQPITLPGRLNTIDNDRRTINRSTPQQPVARQPSVQSHGQVGRASPSPAPAAPRVAPAPTPPQVISRPAEPPRPAVAQRQAAPSKPQPVTRNERRQER